VDGSPFAMHAAAEFNLTISSRSLSTTMPVGDDSKMASSWSRSIGMPS